MVFLGRRGQRYAPTLSCERLPRTKVLAMTLCVVILNTHSVILNGVKNLEVSEAVDCSTNLEILRCTQDDIEPTIDHAHIVHSQRGDTLGKKMRMGCTIPISCQSGADVALT